jgi:TonB family protein
MKNISLQWLNFLIVFVVIFLLGVIVGFLVIPHPSQLEKETPQEAIVSGTVEIRDEVEPVRATGDIKSPKLIKKVEPVYPEIARQSKVEGIVICEATTDIYGRVQRVKVLRSIPLLDQAAIDAIKQWVYEPMLIDGEPRGVTFTVTVNFKLK